MNIAQYSDFVLEFTSIARRGSTTVINLSTLAEIQCIITDTTTNGTVRVSLLKSTSSSRFTVDNTNKIVQVQILYTDYTFVPGTKYWGVLWFTEGSVRYPLEPIEFGIDASTPPA